MPARIRGDIQAGADFIRSARKGDENLSEMGEPKLDKPAAPETSASAHLMPPDQAELYTLLWDAAAEMTHSNQQSLERNWLLLMDAFWRGDLAPDGLTYFYLAPEGREFFVYERMALAGMLLGHHALDTGEKSMMILEIGR